MANFDLINNQLLTRKVLGGTTTDGSWQGSRALTYGEAAIVALFGNKLQALADEGTYFVANNPTAGTAIVDTAGSSAFSATTPLMTVYNGNGASGKTIYLQRLRLNVGAAGTNGTNWNWAAYVDAGNRFTSGGSALTPSNVNLVNGITTGAVINFGAITATAASGSVRKVGASPGRTVIKVIGDEYVFAFGDPAATPVGMAMEGTAQLHRTFALPPIAIAPGYTFLFYEWAASQSVAASFEVQLDYVER